MVLVCERAIHERVIRERTFMESQMFIIIKKLLILSSCR